jgi:hypothetical protein
MGRGYSYSTLLNYSLPRCKNPEIENLSSEVDQAKRELLRLSMQIRKRDTYLVPNLQYGKVESFQTATPMDEYSVHHIIPVWAFKLCDPQYLQSFLPLEEILEVFDLTCPNHAFNMILISNTTHTQIHNFPYREYEAAIESMVERQDKSKNEILETILSWGVPVWDLNMARYLMIVAVLNTADYLLRPINNKSFYDYYNGIINAELCDPSIIKVIKRVVKRLEENYPDSVSCWLQAKWELQQKES